MPQQVLTATENNFTKGLVTEYTGLNFPENAATDTQNCEFTLIGDVVRRLGINQEVNGTNLTVTAAPGAISTYIWNNVNGDGQTRLMVSQIGGTLYFYTVSSSTLTSPLSSQIISSSINLVSFLTTGKSFDTTKECQYAEGNGYLFVFHPSIDPLYCTFVAGMLSANPISIKVRDFVGVVDNLPVNTRPTTLSKEHNYNLQNQGWVIAAPWTAADTTSNFVPVLGSQSFTVASGISGISNGQVVAMASSTSSGGFGPGGFSAFNQGTVTSYSGTTLIINVTSLDVGGPPSTTFKNWTIYPTALGYINSWFTVEGNYPSNADVWWYFKNTSDNFDPATTAGNVTLSIGNAPQGHFVLSAFSQNRTAVSGITSLTPISTNARPSTGAFFQGRIFYTGVNDVQPAAGDVNQYSWVNNIYFSQIVATPPDFGNCYQTDDPTSENLNQLLPSDGGVITIQETGVIHKLFPIQNGILVFADNGIWFVTGNQGIGFSATDYTITQISHVKVLSSKSFVDVNGLPFFWNEEGIYQVMPTQGGALTVEPITVGTILTYYNNIPLASKKYARGAYDPIDYRIQWTFRSKVEGSIANRYQYDSILNYNTYNKAFYPYTIASNGSNYINGINYVSYPFVSNVTPDPGFKYISSAGTLYTFADEHDTNYVDWGNLNYVSYFVTGYKVHGQGLKRLQMPYLYVYSRNEGFIAYYVQGFWDYAINTNSGKQTSRQYTEIYNNNVGVVFKRHRIRGRGMALQFKFSSVDGKPFDFIGWGVYDNVNTGV